MLFNIHIWYLQWWQNWGWQQDNFSTIEKCCSRWKSTTQTINNHYLRHTLKTKEFVSLSLSIDIEIFFTNFQFCHILISNIYMYAVQPTVILWTKHMTIVIFMHFLFFFLWKLPNEITWLWHNKWFKWQHLLTVTDYVFKQSDMLYNIQNNNIKYAKLLKP